MAYGPSSISRRRWPNLRDLNSGHVRSKPTLQRTDSYEARVATRVATCRRHDRDIETQTDIAVSADDDVELRRVRITNDANARRMLEATSYAEIVLAPATTDAAHRAFNKRFVETELLPSTGRFCTRTGRGLPTIRRRGCFTCSPCTSRSAAN